MGDIEKEEGGKTEGKNEGGKNEMKEKMMMVKTPHVEHLWQVGTCQGSGVSIGSPHKPRVQLRCP